MSPEAVPVSIVIPILNESETLPALLSALAAQNAQPAELIFVDAGSSDRSVAIIQDWWRDEPRGNCRLLVLEEVGAFPGGARNAGIARATQPWVAFLDAGVTPDRDWLRTLMDAARSGGAAGVFGVTSFTGRDALSTALCALSYGQGAACSTLPGSVFHHDVFSSVGLFDPALRAGEDVLWLRKYREAWPGAVTEPKATATYSHFPASLGAAARKWFEYERHVTRARVSGSLPLVHIAVAVVAVTVLAIDASAALTLFLLYLVARGIVDPIRRSARWSWWREQPASAVLALPCAAVIDAAKITGCIAGLVERAHV